jgi:hypothetical protein
MNSPVPDYLVPYVLIGAVAVLAATLYLLRRTVRQAGLPDRAFWSGSALLVAWFFAALIPSWFGFYHQPSGSVPTIQYGLFLPMIAGVVLFWRWPVLKRIVQEVPQRWIVGIQVYRVLGLIFLMLYAGSFLPGVFAWPAGAGDVTVGLLAPFVAIAYARRARGSAGLVRAWNLLGISDLVVAVTIGFLTSPSRFQLLSFERPNELIGAFPLVLIPVFAVPLSVLLHLASLYKLRTEVGDRNDHTLTAGLYRPAPASSQIRAR